MLSIITEWDGLPTHGYRRCKLLVVCQVVLASGGETEQLGLTWNHFNMMFTGILHCQMEEAEQAMRVTTQQGNIISLTYARHMYPSKMKVSLSSWLFASL